MASSYLLKKARERAEEIDKKHGEDSYGGTKWLESQKQKTAEKKNEVTTETGGRTAGSVASNYLRDKAKAQQLRVSREYGTGAYGGIGNADRDGYTDFVRAASELRLDPNRYARTEKEEEADVTDTEKEKSPWWDIALESTKYGWSTWNRNLFSTLDAVTPEFTIGGKTIDPFSTISDLYTSENERYRQQMEDSLYGRSQAARIAAEIGAGTIAAAPDALLSVMTSGASAFPSLGKPASGFLNSVRTVLTNLAKNPNYWSSFLQTYGSDYEEMKALGANDFVAESAALVSSLLNAGIEVGGGIETLPARLKNGNRNQILQWALSLPEEGLEEVFQKIVTNVTKKGLVDPDKKWFSMNTEDDAVINPIELAKDFGMGTAVGALLGGSQVGTVSALNAGANAANTKRVSDLGSKYQVHATKTIEEGLSFPENTQAYKTAKEVSDMLSRDGQVSDYDLGRVVIATEQAIRAEENALDTVIGSDAQDGDTETQETLSRLAMETVAEKTGASQDAAQSKSEGIADSGRKTNIPYNVLADKQESSKPAARHESMAEWTGYGENGVRAFNAALERDGSVTPEQMRVRFQSAYEAGLANVPKESVVQSLSDDVMTDAYLAGRQDYVASLQKTPAVSTAGKDSGFDSTGAPKDVSKWEVETVDTLLRSLGVKGSWTNDDRYNARIKGSSIEFSTTFQRNVGGEKRSIVFYAAHEAGMHRLMQLAPTEGRAFINELYRYIGKDRPSTLATLAEEKQAAYKEQNVSLSTEGAMEEISADSIMSLYKNEEEFRSAIEKIANGKNETAKKGLARFREILSDIVKKLRNAISRLTGKDRAEAQKTLDEVEHLRSLYETALRAAVSKNREMESSYTDKRDGKLFRSRDANGTVTLETSVGNPVAQMQENGSAQLSLKTYREFGRAELSKWLEKRQKSGLISKEDASDILTKLDEYYELCQNFKNKYAPFGAWSDAGVVTDAKGKPVFSVIKKNGEYAMNLDFSLVCKKRRTLDAVFGEMIRRGIMDNVDLGEADISRINDIIRESGFETACALCFVDAKRYRQAGVADTFVNKYNDIVRMMLPEDGSVSAHHFDFVGTGNFRDSGTGLHTLTNAQLKDGIAKLRGVMRENGSATVPYKIAKHLIENPQDRRLVSRGEFMNTDGFEAVKLKNPSILRLYNSSKGAGGPKASFSDVQYLGDVMKKSGFTPEKAYAVGGVRIQSFSDYVPRLVFDYIQMTGDLAAKNLPAHAYTKEAMFAKQFGMTGVKINLSLVPAVAENGVAPGLDANGDYLWYDGQSFGSDVNVKGSGKTGFDTAVEIQNAKGYDKNCGTIAVGISDEQIRKMLDDPDIRMIIPYHKSSLNPIVAAMNKIDRYKDYTDTQNTRRKDTGTKITGKEFNFNEALRRTGDAKAATNEYLAWCEKNGYIPKFEQFSGHENYYKLLEDFSTYDSSGASSPQAAVTMTFPTDADAFGSMASLIEQGLEEDAILEARREKGVPEIVDKIEKVLKKKEEYADNSKQAEKERIELSDANTRFSLKDSEGKQLSENQEEFFKDSKVRDKDGNLLRMYHGTSNSGFTVFDTYGGRFGLFGKGSYFTDDRSVAESYTEKGKGTSKGVYEVYLNITNPIDMDADADITKWKNAFSNADLDSSYLSGSVTNEDAFRALKENLADDGYLKYEAEEIITDIIVGMGYDGITHIGGGRFRKQDTNRHRVYIAFEPEQIKRIDNLNPTENPDINYSLRLYEDSERTSLSDEQEKFFRWSTVRDSEGFLLPVYHATLSDFTVFDRKKLGENTDGHATDLYMEATAHVGFFFNTQDLSKDDMSLYDRSVKCYLNIENPYDTVDLNGFANAIEEHGEGEDASDIGASFAKWLEENGYDGVSFLDNEFGGTTYVALYPEQIKSVDNKRPSSDPDINLSTKTEKDLIRENEKLKKVNQALREQFKITKFAKVDKKSLDKFARSILKEYHSSADVEETRDSLDALYTYMANGEDKNPPVWEDLFRSAYDVAESILTNASVTDTEMYDEYKGLRDYLRTTGISIDKQYENDIPGYENLSEFRRANSGRIKLVNDGLPIDTAYQELSSMYPEFFDEDKTSNPADQLSRIAEVLDTLKPMEINPYTDDMRRSATWVANDILDRFFNLPQAKPTYADKAAKKLAETKYRDRVRMEELRAEKNAKIAELIDENRKKVKEARKEGMRKHDEAVKLLQERYNAKQEELSEARRASALQEKIERHARQLSQKLLNPTDKQHIPEVLRKPVAKVLDAINMESPYTIDPKTGKRNRNKDGDPVTRTLAFADLRAAYQKIMQEDGSDIVVDPEMSYMLDLVIKMRDVKLSNMMPSQLEAVWNVVRSLEHTISLSGKILSTMKYAKTVDLANAMVESTATRRVMRGRDIEDIRLALENPYTFFSHYGEAGKEIYRMLRNAQDEQQIMTNDVRDKVEKIVDEKTASNLEREVHKFKTERGDSLVLTKAHIMDIYLLSRREQAQAHLMQGGIVQPEVKPRNIKRGTDSILISLDDIQDIISTMTEKERKIADSLQELTRTTLAKYGNSASLKAYGYKKFTGEDYWPIKSAKEGVHSNVEKGADNTRSIKNIGLAKSVVIGANNPLDIGGAFNTFASHASDMIDYAAWLCPMEDANRLYNFRFKDDSGSYNGKSIKGILNRYGGKNADKYWHRLMEDIQNGIKPVSDNAISQKVGRMIGNARGAAVGANIRVIIQQPTAIIRASMVLSPVDMVAGLVGGGGWKTALKHSAIAKRKDAGGFDMSSPAQMKSTLFGGDTKLQKFNEAMMAGASAADAVTWGRIWSACENAVKRKKRNLAPKSKEFYEAVDELFTEVIDQTQVVDGVLQRSQAMRSGDTWLNQATAFMGEPTMSLNMLLREYENFAGEKDAKKRGAAMRKFGRAAFVLIATNTVNALAQSLVDAWRDDDDDEYWNKFWKAFTGIDGSEESAWEKAMSAVLYGNFFSGLNPFGYIPVAKDFLSLVQGYDVSRADADIMSDILNASKKFSESLKDGKTTVARASFDLSKQVAKVFGISLPNIERDITGIMRQIAFETGNVAAQYEMEKWSYKIGNDKNKSRFEDILYKAYSEDRAAYDHIRSDLLRNGFTGDELDAAINARKEKSALSGTGYESAKEAYDALYSMKQSGRIDSYDQLRRTLLEASYTDINGRNERLFTEKNIESAMQTRRVNEGIQSMGYSSKDGVYDAMYESIRNDDMTEYYKKVVSMMGLGVDASDIESAMRTRAKADGLSVSDLTKALASGGFKPKFETESADTFDIDDLSTDEYTTYSGEYGDMIDRLMDDFAKRGFDALSPEDANKWLGSAYSYAKETALEIATDGEYDSDTKWINDAQQAEKNGISVSDYIITKDEYGSSVADKLYDAKKNGISVDQYQEYRDMLDKYDEPNENGNLGSYTSAERVKAISAVDGLGDREIAFLWDTDQGYEALSYGIDMNKYIQFKAAQENIKADKDKNGNSISGSRREKIEDYLNSMGLSYKEYLYLLGTEYSTVKKNKDYIEYFG